MNNLSWMDNPIADRQQELLMAQLSGNMGKVATATEPYVVLKKISNVMIKVPDVRNLNFIPASKSSCGKAYFHNGQKLGYVAEKPQYYNRHYYVPDRCIGGTICARVEIKRKIATNGQVYIHEDIYFKGMGRGKTDKIVKLVRNAKPGSGVVIIQQPEWQAVIERI